MGRMIDAYFFPDKDHPHKWWCGFKQNGMGLSYTYDFETWTYYDKVVAGENVCVLVDREADEYVLIHAPRNGVGIKRSKTSSNGATWASGRWDRAKTGRGRGAASRPDTCWTCGQSRA